MSTMTDREKVVKLATEVMGCEAVVKRGSDLHVRLISDFSSSFAVYDRDNGPIYICGKNFIGAGLPWNPLEWISDAMEMQAKILAMPKIADDYLFRMADLLYHGNAIVGVKRIYRFLLEATARQRCDAAISVLEARCRK